MPVLDVQFAGESVRFGRSTSYDANEEMVVATLFDMATNLRRETGEPTEALVGVVRKPSPARLQTSLSHEVDACEASAFAHVAAGAALRSCVDGAELVVVVDGRGTLRAAGSCCELGPGSVALLPATGEEPITATTALTLLVYPIP